MIRSRESSFIRSSKMIDTVYPGDYRVYREPQSNVSVNIRYMGCIVQTVEQYHNIIYYAMMVDSFTL